MSLLNTLIVKVTQLLPKSIVRVFAGRYIAGEELQDAINLVKTLNSKGIYATMDVLGESIKNKEEAIEAKKKCFRVLEAIKTNELMANLSIKPTQMGLAIDEEFAYQQILEIVQTAKSFNNFVRIDMEDSPYTDSTIKVFKRLHEKIGHVGLALQAYLKRTLTDIEQLNKLGTNYRLCKGIYVESETIAYKKKQIIRDKFLEDLRLMLGNGNYVGIATHDDYLIENSYKMIKEMNIPKDKFEFQMLLGVKEELRDRINSDCYKVRIYVPFGEDWFAYSIRRLKENPQIAGYVFKNIFSFGK
ncbi:MAG: proline dehydrogenase [Ignavibacteria bacterium RIFOXYB2_FULL_35_12]|nr:MAG: proline dehydrogenase [Ignavibacteria bacterium GWA2_36_19]OGU50672.1 MAG: proline dehydrogenase [Ignavibacteria bacterium GWC2_35_8]OGU60357.1 MAG: proline dehydrogenase [Ignavibacteria bacterium GWF2_35_20]OGU81452.1 MAG: proline dehydrogenase [Ignavibacteria bacterium RIFOXYA2_FULL_35_9]OGU90446.1 MAG: proline dehydrogenase [Ignavibacteria bacterium RIFOXYA12_FULL_35_25]OGU92614.1 MAG: proline dehydrogenase [Ignavibacteria bacterium RIFOXYC12_FULL_35_11]OGU94275.1 MAG: proline dehy